MRPWAGSTRCTPGMAATVSSEPRNRSSGSAARTRPEMWGVIVGSTWSPEISVPAAGSSRHRWSTVWPGVWTATHSVSPMGRISPSTTRREGCGGWMKRLATRLWTR